MPRSMQCFVGLSLVYILWFCFWTLFPLLWPTAHELETLAKLPLPLRHSIEQGERIGALLRAAFFLLPVIAFAALASFGRQGWARWGLVIVLVLPEVLWPLYIGFHYWPQPQYHPMMYRLLSAWLQSFRFDAAHWAMWVRIALKLALIVVPFLPDARPWFRKTA